MFKTPLAGVAQDPRCISSTCYDSSWTGLLVIVVRQADQQKIKETVSSIYIVQLFLLVIRSKLYFIALIILIFLEFH